MLAPRPVKLISHSSEGNASESWMKRRHYFPLVQDQQILRV